MRTGLTATVVLAALLVTGPVWAEEAAHERQRDAPAAVGAAVLNVVFMPVRLAITSLAGFAGGFVGMMTGGDLNAADDVWNVFRGENLLTPDIVQGRRSLHAGAFEFRAVEPHR